MFRRSPRVVRLESESVFGNCTAEGAGEKRRALPQSVVPMIRCAQRKFTGTKRMASAAKNSKSNVSSTEIGRRQHQFVICVRNDENPASLELRKLYEVIPDGKAAKHRMLRIVDESGEDYLYPEDYFIAVKLPQAVGRAVLSAAR